MDIFLINLDSRSDRLSDMTARFAAQGLNFTRITAIDGTGDNDIGYPEGYPHLAKPEFACYLSHLSAYQALLDSGAPHCLVIEDDIFLAKSFASVLNNPDLFIPEHSILRLEIPFQNTFGLPTHYGPVTVVDLGTHTQEILRDSTECTGAYIITRDLAKRILDDHSQPVLPVDVLLLSKKLRKPGVKVYQILPPVAIQTRYHGPVMGDSSALSDLEEKREDRHSPMPAQPTTFIIRELRRRKHNFKVNINRINTLIKRVIFKSQIMTFYDD